MKLLKKLSLFLPLSLLTISLAQAQSDQFRLFRKAVIQLQQEFGPTKEARRAEYEEAKKMFAEKNERDMKITIIPSAPPPPPPPPPPKKKVVVEEEEIVFEDMAIEEAPSPPDVKKAPPPPPPPPAPKKKIEIVEEEIEFVDMAVEEEAPAPKKNIISPPPPPPPAPKKETKVVEEEIEFADMEVVEEAPPARTAPQWKSTEVFTGTYEIDIDDIEDPDERARLKSMGKLYEADFALARVLLIDRMEEEIKTEQDYQELLDAVGKTKFDLRAQMNRASALEEQEQVEYAKQVVLRLIDFTLRR